MAGAVLESATLTPDVGDARRRLHDFYRGRDEARYWAFDFDKVWEKHRRAIRQESERTELISRWLDLRGAKVLVVGSYLGAEAIAYALRGARVTAIDLDEQVIDLSRQFAREQNVDIDIRVMDATRTPFPDGHFDLVSCSQVLEHLPRDEQPRLLGEMWRVCKPGGLFWLDTPNQLNFHDHHDTGLPFIHWLPRSLKVPLAKWLGRSVPAREPAFGNRPVHLHYYLSYFGVKGILGRLGRFEILSRYRGYADLDHYHAARQNQGRAVGLRFRFKLVLLKGLLRFWNWNWLAGMRLVVRKCA